MSTEHQLETENICQHVVSQKRLPAKPGGTAPRTMTADDSMPLDASLAPTEPLLCLLNEELDVEQVDVGVVPRQRFALHGS